MLQCLGHADFCPLPHSLSMQSWLWIAVPIFSFSIWNKFPTFPMALTFNLDHFQALALHLVFCKPDSAAALAPTTPGWVRFLALSSLHFAPCHSLALLLHQLKPLFYFLPSAYHIIALIGPQATAQFCFCLCVPAIPGQFFLFFAFALSQVFDR